METLIVICLLVVIGLLLHDKISLKKSALPLDEQVKETEDLPDIMGKPKSIRSQALPSTARESQKESMLDDVHSFDHETIEAGFDREIPPGEPEEVLEEVPDFEEEEEEWAAYREPNGESGFATGVTFDELMAVEMLLGQDNPGASREKRAAEIVQRLQGTELFALLENSIEGASQKIAKLLDKTLTQETEPGSTQVRNSDMSDFDIGEFL